MNDVHMTLVVSPEINQLLEASPYKPSEYLRRALALYEIVTAETKRGHKIAVLDRNDKVLQEIIGI
jgi:hypothetical protein